MMMRVEMRKSVLWISAFPHAVVFEASDAITWGRGPKPGGLLFAFGGDQRITAQHVVRIGGDRAISATIVQAIRTRNALIPTFSWLRHSHDGGLRRRQFRHIKVGSIAPERIQQATEATRQRHDSDPPTPARG